MIGGYTNYCNIFLTNNGKEIMKILFYQNLPSINSTLLTWTLCEELRLRGHHVDYGKINNENLPKNHNVKYDWVHGAGYDTWDALKFARAIGAKCHIHLEGVAYWRIGVGNAIDWGYERNHTQAEIDIFRNQYKDWMSAAFEADSCTVNGIRQIETIENVLFGKKLPNCHLMCCGVDARYAVTLPDWNKENYMVTVSRLEPNKKVFKIAEALAILKKRGVDIPPWVIIGYGSSEQVRTLQDFCKENAIIFDLGQAFGAEKWHWVKRARLMLCGWMGVPPAEGIMCRVPVLSYSDTDVCRKYEDTIWFADDPMMYADQIEYLLDPDDLDKTMYALDRLLDNDRHGKGELFANTQPRAALQYEKIFKNGM